MADYKDSADISADEAVARQTKTRDIQNELDKVHRLPKGRNNEMFTKPKYPGQDSADPKVSSLGKHSADFIDATRRKDRGAANAARVAFHAVKATTRSVPKGLEQPCPTGDCSRANVAPTTCEATGGCTPMGGSPKVGRPRG